MDISFGEGTTEDILQINAEIPEFDARHSKQTIEARLVGRVYLLLVAWCGDQRVGE